MLPYYGGEVASAPKWAGSMRPSRGYDSREIGRPSDMMSGGIHDMFNNMMESHNRAIDKFEKMSNKMMGFDFGSKKLLFFGNHKIF